MAVIEEGEEVERPLKRRRRLVRLADQPLRSSVAEGSARPSVAACTSVADCPLTAARPSAADQPSRPSGRSKGKGKTGDAGQWESLIKLPKDSSTADLDVSRHIMERITPPADGERFDRWTNSEMAAFAVRGFLQGAVMSFEAAQRLEVLDQEVEGLQEQMEALKDKLSKAEEERDLLKAQNSSLEEERKIREEAANVLKAQVDTGEEEMRVLRAQLTREELERVKAMAERSRLSEEYATLRGLWESERVLKEKSLRDHAQTEEKLRKERADHAQTEEALRRERASIKEQRIEAIERWQRRFLREECLEYSCDLAVMILKNCYDACVPEGSDGPSFDEFARPLVPNAVGLSLEEVKERAEEDRGTVPREELDLSSEEEDELPHDDTSAAAPLEPASASAFPSASGASPTYSPGYCPSPSAACSSPSPLL